MGRPKTTGSTKTKLTLTVSSETKEMLEVIRVKKRTSISAMLEEMVCKEYKKLKKEEEKKTNEDKKGKEH